MLNYIKDFFQKENLRRNLNKLFLLLLGSLILAVGSAFFLIPFGIVTGGITGITILLSHVISPDIMSYILNWSLFFIGFIFLGIRFTLSSLVSTLLFPVFLSLFTRTGMLEDFLQIYIGSPDVVLNNGVIQNLSSLTNIDTGFLFITGILGSVLVGLGVALTFHGGGSTGGLDILTFIVSKYTGIKESIPFFLFDGSIVLAGIIVDLVSSDSSMLIVGFIGIICAFICAVVIEIVYNGQISSYSVDIISDKYDEFIKFAFDEINRGATIFDITGAYSNEKKKMIRINFSRREYSKVRNAIAKIDPKAFCTFYQTLFVGGEGFRNIKGDNESSISIFKKLRKKKDGK